MTTIKRYDNYLRHGSCVMEEASDGEWIRFEDVFNYHRDMQEKFASVCRVLGISGELARVATADQLMAIVNSMIVREEKG